MKLALSLQAKQTLRTIGLLALSVGLSACGCGAPPLAWQSLVLTDVGPLPPHFDAGASTFCIRMKMGNPNTISDWMWTKSERIGTIYRYGDYGFDEIGRTNNWGSWDLYFDLTDRLVGWQLAEPMPAADSARQRFVNYMPEGHRKIIKSRHDAQAAIRRLQLALSKPGEATKVKSTAPDSRAVTVADRTKASPTKSTAIYSETMEIAADLEKAATDNPHRKEIKALAAACRVYSGQAPPHGAAEISKLLQQAGRVMVILNT